VCCIYHNYILFNVPRVLVTSVLNQNENGFENRFKSMCIFRNRFLPAKIFRLLGLFNPINRDNYRNQVNPHGEHPTILSLMSYDAQTTEADKAPYYTIPYHTIYHTILDPLNQLHQLADLGL